MMCHLVGGIDMPRGMNLFELWHPLGNKNETWEETMCRGERLGRWTFTPCYVGYGPAMDQYQNGPEISCGILGGDAPLTASLSHVILPRSELDWYSPA